MHTAQPPVAGPDALPCADDATAWLYLYWERDEEFGPSFHALKSANTMFQLS